MKIGLAMMSLWFLVSADPGEELIPSDVRAQVTRRVEQGECAGLIIGAVSPKGTSYFARGLSSKEKATAVNEDTIFEIGSITKAFTSILLVEMASRELLSLDDPVQKFLPPDAKMPVLNDKPITLRDLSTHRSGLPRLPDNMDPADMEDPYRDYTAEKLLDFLSKHQLTRDAGVRYEYSNLGAGLLGYALTRKAGASYEQLVIERIADPLGMKDTRIQLSQEQRSRFAQGYVDGAPVKHWELSVLEGAGALRSTAKDMIRFLSANLGLSESSLSKILSGAWKDRYDTQDPDLFVSLGWHVWTKHGVTIVWHNGGTGGFRSFCGFRPDQKIGVVVLTNSQSSDYSPSVIDQIGLHLLEPKYELQPVPTVVRVPEKLLDEYVGYYEIQPGVVFDVSREGEQLFAQITGESRFPLFAESETRFFYRTVDARISFVRGPEGSIDHLILHRDDEKKARRLKDYKPPVRVEVKVDPAILAKYVGKYQLGPGWVFDVALDDGQLKVKLADQPRFPVFAESELKFFYKVVDAQLTFVKDEGGNVTSLILHQFGRDQTAQRLP